MGRPLRRVPGVGLGRRGGRARPCARPPRRSPARPCRSARSPSRTSTFRTSGVPELDRVLGGGLVPGAAILLAGEPGVGKSTLLLEVAAQTARYQRRTLYVTGEESASQVRLRADRTGGVHDELYLAAETDLGAVLTHIEQVRPTLLVVDSIQTIGAAGIDGVPGGVTQVKEVAAALIRVAKTRNITTVLVGHVTKDGSIAGPRVLEHVVDVVLHFEGDRNSRFRMVRAMKNRFGPIDEVGCFDLVRRRHRRGHRPDRAVRREPPPAGRRHLRRGDDGGPPAAARRGAGPGHPQRRRAPTAYDVRARLVPGRDGARGAPAALRHPAARPRRLRLHRRRRPAVRAGERPGGGGRPGLGQRRHRRRRPGVVAMGEIGLAGELRRVRDLPQRLAEAGAARLPGRRGPGRPARAWPAAPTRRARSTGCGSSTLPDIASALRVLQLGGPARPVRATDL